MKTKICDFSAFRIHPGHGFTFVRGDSRSFSFITYKSSSLFMKKRNPRQIAWTQVYRKLHKKDASGGGRKKKTVRRRTKAPRAIVGASLEHIRAKQTQSADARAQERNAAIKEIRERKRKLAARKKAKRIQASKGRK